MCSYSEECKTIRMNALLSQASAHGNRVKLQPYEHYVLGGGEIHEALVVVYHET